MKCQFCGTEIADRATFCVSCGRQQDSVKRIQPMFCTNCGAKLKEGAKFCGSCGKTVKNLENRQVAETISLQAEEKVTQSMPYQNEQQDSGENKIGMIICIVVICALLCVGIGIGIWYLASGRNGKQTEPKNEKTVTEQQTTTQAVTTEATTAAATDAAPQPTEEVKETVTEAEPPAQEVQTSNVVKVTATSSLSEYGMTHSPERIIDGDLSTAWVEGAGGQGRGESVTLDFGGTYTVSGFTIYPGYQKSEDLYYKNSRPSALRVTYSDGTVEEFTLEDKMGAQMITFSDPVQTDSLTLEIESVYAGTKYQDTVITEINIF